VPPPARRSPRRLRRGVGRSRQTRGRADRPGPPAGLRVEVIAGRALELLARVRPDGLPRTGALPPAQAAPEQDGTPRDVTGDRTAELDFPGSSTRLLRELVADLQAGREPVIGGEQGSSCRRSSTPSTAPRAKGAKSRSRSHPPVRRRSARARRRGGAGRGVRRARSSAARDRAASGGRLLGCTRAVAQLVDGDLTRHRTTVARTATRAAERGRRVVATNRGYMAATQSKPPESARIWRLPDGEAGDANALHIAANSHDRSRRLKIVVSPVRVRVSPSEEMPANDALWWCCEPLLV
jgi:hypothetical protein